LQVGGGSEVAGRACPSEQFNGLVGIAVAELLGRGGLERGVLGRGLDRQGIGAGEVVERLAAEALVGGEPLGVGYGLLVICCACQGDDAQYAEIGSVEGNGPVPVVQSVGEAAARGGELGTRSVGFTQSLR